MTTWLATGLAPLGILFPESLIRTQWFAVLAAFVALNTIVYVALAIAKALPKIYFSDYRRRRYERSETRSIHPDGPL